MATTAEHVSHPSIRHLASPFKRGRGLSCVMTESEKSRLLAAYDAQCRDDAVDEVAGLEGRDRGGDAELRDLVAQAVGDAAAGQHHDVAGVRRDGDERGVLGLGGLAHPREGSASHLLRCGARAGASAEDGS